MKERQELYCHHCNKYVQFDLDLDLNGNHILECPVCGHEHCRVVENGKITSERWDSRNGNAGNVYFVSSTTTTYTTTSTFDTYTTNSTYDQTGGDLFRYDAWMNTTSTK